MDIRLTNTEFDRSPASALRLAESGVRVIVSGSDGSDRAWLTAPGYESEAAADE